MQAEDIQRIKRDQQLIDTIKPKADAVTRVCEEIVQQALDIKQQAQMTQSNTQLQKLLEQTNHVLNKLKQCGITG